MSFIKKQINKEIKKQWLIAWNDSIKKENQYQKHTARVNLSYRSLKKLWKIDRLMFSTFIQLKMKHDYFKSYLHQLSDSFCFWTRRRCFNFFVRSFFFRFAFFFCFIFFFSRFIFLSAIKRCFSSFLSSRCFFSFVFWIAACCFSSILWI